MDKPLFNPKTVERFSSKVKLTRIQKAAAKSWLYLLEQGKLTKEKLNYFKFVEFILKDLLGYDIKESMDHEAGYIEFSFKNKQGKTVLGIEAKGTKTKDLFAEQKGYREGQKTPINQLWTYMGKLDLDYGIATNYKDFVLIDRTKGSSTYHFFDFEEIRNNDAKLKEFIAIFSKEQIIDNNFIEKLKEESDIEERNFTKEFYKLFNETRLMLVKEFQEKGISKEETVHYAQLFLNRLMFVFFAEDTANLEKRYFEKKILQVLESGILDNHSTFIAAKIRNIFRELDKEVPKQINGFNGELFKEEIPSKISFKDFRDKRWYIAIYQHSKLKKEPELDPISKKIFAKYENKINPIIKNLLIMASFDFNTEVNVNILGHIFEQSLSDLEELKEDKTTKRKKEGIFYTPEYITDYICRNTIIPYLSKRKASTSRELVLEHQKDIKELEEKLKLLKILDPACGSGAFLIKAVDILLDIHKEIQLFKQDKGQYTAVKRGLKKKKDKGQLMLIKWNEEDEARKIIENNICGVDLNEESIEITKLSLFLKIARKNRKLIDLSKNIKCGNSLIDDKSIDKKAFDWNKEFKEIFNKGGFDIIIGNPPYGVKFNKQEKKYLSTFDTLVPDYEIYIYFISKAKQLLKSKGYLGYIFPNTFLVTQLGQKYRENFINHYSVQSITDLSKDKTFEDASVRTCIFISRKSKEVQPIQLNLYDIKTNSIRLVKNVSEDYLRSNLSNILTLFSVSKNYEKVIQKIKTDKDVVNFYFDVSQGLIPYDKYRGHDEQTIKNRIWHSPYPKDKTYRKELKGGDVSRYLIAWNGKTWISYGNWLAAPREPRFFQNPRVLVREIIGNNLFCSYTKEEYYNTPSIINIVQKVDKQFPLKSLLAILNSTLIGWYTYNTSPKAKKGLFPKILVNDIRNIPLINFNQNKEKLKHAELKANLMIKLNKEFSDKKIKFLNRVEQNLNLKKVTKKLEEFYNLCFKEFCEELQKKKIKLSITQQDEWEDYFNKYKKELLELKEKIDKTDKEIDEMVYKLYELTPEEIKIVEEFNGK